MKFALPVAVALVVIIAASILQGRISERWERHDSETLREYVARIQTLPMNIGKWQGEDRVLSESEKRQFDKAQASGRISRTYHNPSTGQSVSISLICGHSQHVSQHTPPQCYVSAGFSMIRDPSLFTPPNHKDVQFRTANFRKETAHSAHQLQIYWSWWAEDVKWIAPTVQTSKWKFAGEPALFKLYVIDTSPLKSDKKRMSAAVEFMRDTVPAFENTFSGRYLSGQ